MIKDLDRTRILHGMLWGMVAAPIAAIVPLTAMLLSLWPAPAAFLITREEDGRLHLPFTKLRLHHA